jgi:hypothetical protein
MHWADKKQDYVPTYKKLICYWCEAGAWWIKLVMAHGNIRTAATPLFFVPDKPAVHV